MCLPGTRVDVLKEIIDCAIDPEEMRGVLLFTGLAGAETIAHTIADHFKSAGGFAASFCFDRGSRATRGPGTRFITIARSLADINSEFKLALCGAICKDTSAWNSLDPNIQFDHLPLSPVKDLKITGPVVFIIVS